MTERARVVVDARCAALRVDALTAMQERMGLLNDLFVARKRYQALATPDPGAWFALGWLAARVSELRALAKSELEALAKVDPPAA